MNDKKRNMLIGVGILVVVLIIVAVAVNKHYQGIEQANNNPANAILTAPNVMPTPAVSPTVVKAYNAVSYEQALTKYKDRFQFATCNSGTPNSIAIRQGSPFMLDNRDSVSHSFTVSGKKYSIRGYDFAIVTASTIGNNPILCDGKNSVTLNVQK